MEVTVNTYNMKSVTITATHSATPHEVIITVGEVVYKIRETHTGALSIIKHNTADDEVHIPLKFTNEIQIK